jgi:hypothetical protein
MVLMQGFLVILNLPIKGSESQGDIKNNKYSCFAIEFKVAVNMQRGSLKGIDAINFIQGESQK